MKINDQNEQKPQPAGKPNQAKKPRKAREPQRRGLSITQTQPGLKAMQECLGHSEVTLTLDTYTHPRESFKNEREG